MRFLGESNEQTTAGFDIQLTGVCSVPLDALRLSLYLCLAAACTMSIFYLRSYPPSGGRRDSTWDRVKYRS
jgi:hypothetical protein